MPLRRRSQNLQRQKSRDAFLVAAQENRQLCPNLHHQPPHFSCFAPRPGSSASLLLPSQPTTNDRRRIGVRPHWAIVRPSTPSITEPNHFVLSVESPITNSTQHSRPTLDLILGVPQLSGVPLPKVQATSSISTRPDRQPGNCLPPLPSPSRRFGTNRNNTTPIAC